jgi:hypothetical protein
VESCNNAHAQPRQYPCTPAVKMSETVEFSAKVPKDTYNEFKELVPPYGSVQWFINASLAEFVKRVKEEPTLKHAVAASVEAMLQLNRLNKETGV